MNELRSEYVKIPLFFKIYNKGLIPALLYNIVYYEDCDFKQDYNSLLNLPEDKSKIIGIGETYEFTDFEQIMLKSDLFKDKDYKFICFEIAGADFSLKKVILIKLEK